MHQTCVDPEQLAVCEGLVQEAACTTRTIPDGKCFDGVCLPAGCGNGIIETGEMCERGQSPTGRCSPDCTSTEVCGNGIVDPVRGEECDDGDLLNHDGCSSSCAPEVARWIRHVSSAAAPFVLRVPPARTAAAIAYDAARGEIVMFGGQSNGNALGDTWIWRHGTWRVADPVAAPSPRFDHAMTYDPRRQRVVLVGGATDALSQLNDTWEWNGETWARPATSTSPGRRAGHRIAYDPISQRVLLFGGDLPFSFGELDDTWTWDGTTWTRLAVSGPPRRADHAMAVDSIRRRIVVAGGRSFDGVDDVPLGDTWAWDGSAWTEIATAVTSPRTGASMMFDPGLGELVMFGGTGAATEAFDGATWRTIATTGPSRTSHAMAFDVEGGAGVLFGGSAGAAETWLWQGGAWASWSSPSTPSPPRNGQLVYDRARGNGVLVGGRYPHDDTRTWIWDGAAWSARTSPQSPEPVVFPGVAYDSLRGRVIVFGGSRQSNRVDTTWEWDGTAWTELVPPARPPARSGHAMVYDEARGRVVMFGGNGASGVLSDTWQLADGTWTRLADVGPARSAPKMVYDVRRDKIVLFGGDSASAPLGDTWEWDGSAWVQHVPPLSPEPRTDHAMVYDRRRDRVVLFGGWSLVAGIRMFQDLWEWDGQTWQEAPLASQQPILNQSATMYDEARAEIVAYESFFLDTTFEMTTLKYGGSVAEACHTDHDLDGDTLAGCADPDCAWACAPLCPIATGCTREPRCGDSRCDPVEDARSCSMDCGAPLAVCGDWYCDSPETSASCADCP